MFILTANGEVSREQVNLMGKIVHSKIDITEFDRLYLSAFLFDQSSFY